MTDSTDRYPPGSWTLGEVRDALTTGAGRADLPTYDDASRWRTIADDGLTGEYATLIVEAAESKRGEPVSRLPASLFADYQRTGNRDRYQRAYYDRQHRLTLATLAACLERDGRFLDDVLDHVWATCETTTWLLPAHLPEEERTGGLPTACESVAHHVALFSARTAHMLAEVDHLLGDRLNPALRDRIRREVDRRVLTPFERRDDFHWRQPPTGNWSAVCNASVAMAALYLEDDPDRQAEILLKATSGLDQYLDSFGADGCTPEGLAYWNFCFSHYVMLAAALDSRTAGRLSLFSPPVLESAARFPLRIALSPARHVPFSDSRETDDVDPFLACYVGDELDVPALTATGRRSLAAADRPFFQRGSDSLVETVRNLCWCQRASTGTQAVPERQHFFGDCEWWFARSTPADPDGLVVAAKAGHNDEPHNHNDCGSVVVHRGGESSVTDLGAGRYDRDYFSEKRYEALATRSLGHSVPYVNGCEQAHGADYAATVLEHESTADVERFEMDLTDCYPSNTGLSSLTRAIALDRTTDEVTITDAASFDSAADPTFESVFMSAAPAEVSADGVTIQGDRTRTRITFDTPLGGIETERLTDAHEVSTGDFDYEPRDVWRTRVTGSVESERESAGLSSVVRATIASSLAE